MAMAAKMQDTLHPVGRALLHLNTVETASVKSNYPTNPDGTADVFYWPFISNIKDEFGDPLKMRKMTDVKVTPNNQTMKFWKQLQPGVTYETCSGDTSDLEGKWYEAEIVHNTKGDKTYADIAFIKPYVKRAQAPEPELDTAAKPIATKRPQAPVPVVTDPDEEADPFADD